MTAPSRVMIADDHPLFCDGLAALLTDGPGTELAGTATTGTEAVDLAREIQPRRGPDGPAAARDERHRGNPAHRS
jgi:chemotaxis response regulator CheB